MSKLAKKRLGDWAVVALCLLISVALGWTVTQVQQQSAHNDRQSEQIDALAGALAAEQDAAEDRGETPVAPEPEELIEDPETKLPEPQGPTDAQVYAAVSAYFTAHPVEDGEDGEDVSPAQIAAAVGNYLTEHPPEQGEPGPPPSGDQVAAAVETYLIANPPPAGPPGEDGEDASPEAIAQAVAAYIETHPIEYCPDGYSLIAHTVLTTEGPTDQIDCVADEPEEN